MAAEIIVTGGGVVETAERQIVGPALFKQYLTEGQERRQRTAQTYTCNLKQFQAYLLYAGISNPDRDDVANYRDWLRSEHDAIKLDPDSPAGWSYRTDKAGTPLKVSCSVATAADYLRTVKQLFRWTKDQGIYEDVARDVQVPAVSKMSSKDALTPDQVRRVEESIARTGEARRQAAGQAEKDTAGRMQRADEQALRSSALYMLAVNAGLRTCELSRAKVKDFETKDGKAYLWIWGKGHDAADAKKALAAEVAEAIRDYLKARPDRLPGQDRPAGAAPLFAATGNRSGGQAIAPATIGKMLKRAMQEAGFDSPKLTAHSLRHTTGTTVQGMAHDLYATQQYLRHKRPETTEQYIHLDNVEREGQLAQDLFDLYHGKSREEDAREKLARIAAGMDAERLERLAQMAELLA